MIFDVVPPNATSGVWEKERGFRHMSLEAILDPKGTQYKQKSITQGRQTPLRKPKEADVPCHMRPLTHALSHAGSEWAGGVTR